MKLIFTLLTFFAIAELSLAQNAELFYKKGDSLFRARDYNHAASVYASAIKNEGSKARVDRFITVARQWCLANRPDSAFYWLNQLATSPHIAAIDIRTIENNKDFKLLETDKRWSPLLNS